MPTNRSTSTEGSKVAHVSATPRDKLQDATTSTVDVPKQQQPQAALSGTGKKKNKKKKKKKNNASNEADLDHNNNSVDGLTIVSTYASNDLREAAVTDPKAFLEHKLYNHAFDQLSNNVVDQAVPAATSSTERARQQERIKNNLAQELQGYSESTRLIPLYDKETTFETAVPTTVAQSKGLTTTPVQLVLRIDLSRPNQIKFFSSSKSTPKTGGNSSSDPTGSPNLPHYKIDFTLPAILAFLLHRLRPVNSPLMTTPLANSSNAASSGTNANAGSSKKGKQHHHHHSQSDHLTFSAPDGTMLSSDKTCPFHLQGLQQISTSNSNMLLILIAPSMDANVRHSKNDAAIFQKKVSQWLRRYSANDLFFTELDHIYEYTPPNGQFPSSFPQACRPNRKDGIFDTCKILPVHVDKLAALAEYVEIDGSPGLAKVFERQPSLLWNCGIAQREQAAQSTAASQNIESGCLSAFSDHAMVDTADPYLQQWPCLAIGYNLLREPRIMCEYFARILPSQCSNFVGIRLTFPTRRQLDKISLREHSTKYNYNTFNHSRLRGGDATKSAADSPIPTVALCIRGHRNIKQNLRMICGPSNLSIAIQKCSGNEGEMNLNGTYKECFETDQSYFWSPLNNGAALRVLAVFFGGRLASPPDDMKLGVETYPEGRDPLLDLIRKDSAASKEKSPETDQPDGSTAQTADLPPAPTKSKKSKKKNKKKGKVAKPEEDDIDALVAKLGLECYEAPTQDDSLFYTLTLAPIEELFLVISPAVESHLMATIQNTCLEVGFRIKSCNACRLEVEEDGLTTPTQQGDARVCIDPHMLNVGRVGRTTPNGRAWCCDDMVRVFYPNEARKAFEKILEGDDYSDEDGMDKCERQHELVGARFNMSSRCAYVLHLTRENAHSLARSLLSRLFIENILNLIDDVSPDHHFNRRAYDQFQNMFTIKLVTPSLDGSLYKAMQTAFTIQYQPVMTPLIARYARPLATPDAQLPKECPLQPSDETIQHHSPCYPLPEIDDPGNAYTSTKLERSVILQQESEQMAILVCHSEISTQFVDVTRELFSLNDYYYRSPLLYQHRGSEYPTYPEFELLLMRSFRCMDAQIAHLLCPLEIGNPRYHALMQDLIHGDGVIIVLRAVCAKQRLKEHLEFIEQSHYSNSSPGLYEESSAYWPFFTICSDRTIQKILPTLGPLYSDSATRPLARFLAPLRGANGHENFQVETFSFVLVRPHAVKQGLTKILARIAQCGFEVVAIKKTQVQADQIDDIGACKVPELGRQGMQPLIREMWSKDLMDSECVVMVVKRVNAVYQMHILAGIDQQEYAGSGIGNEYGMFNRPHSALGQAQQEGGYWQHNASVVKNGPTLRSLAGSSLIQNAVWVPDSYDEAMEEIKRFFPNGLPAEIGHNPIIVSENFPECPAYDTEVAINLRKVIHVHKGNRLYPENPESLRNGTQSDRYMGSLAAFSTSFTSVNTTNIAIIILDHEMFKVQELIDVDEPDTEEDQEHQAGLAVSEDDVIITPAEDNEQNFGDDETTSSEIGRKHAASASRHRYYHATTGGGATSSGSSLGEQDDAPAAAPARPAIQVPSSSSEQLLTEDQCEDSDVDVETTSQPTITDAERLRKIKQKKAGCPAADVSCSQQLRAEPTIASAISEKTTRLNSRLHTNVPQSLLNATKYTKVSSSSPCYSSSSSGSNSISANYAAGRLPPPIPPDSSSSDPKQQQQLQQQPQQQTSLEPVRTGSSSHADSDRPGSQAAHTSSAVSLGSGRVSSQEAQKKTKRNLPNYLDTSTPAYINVLKALMQASYRVIAMRRTWLRDDQAANLFGINYCDFASFSPTGVEESINFEWAQKLSSGSSLILAVQRHGAAYALLDTTLENFKDYDRHIFKTKTRQQALHFTASLFKSLPKDAVWKVEHDPC